jgi:hypothetical protein
MAPSYLEVGASGKPGAVQVVEQDAVLERLMPALDLALRLRVVGRAADMIHALAVEPLGQILADVGAAVVTEQSRPVQHGDVVQP